MSHSASMDVIIVGNGIIGASLALKLARQGAQVQVIDRGPGLGEASWAAGGILAPQLEADQDGPFFRLGLASRQLYPAFVQEVEQLVGMPTGFRRCGLVQVTTTEAGSQHLRGRLTWQRQAGLAAVLHEGPGLADLPLPLAPGVRAALHLPDEVQVDNRALLSAVRIAAERSGARFQVGQVTRLLERSGRLVGLEVDGQSRPAQTVVVAAGAWSGLLPGSTLTIDQVAPVRGQMLLLRLSNPVFGQVLFHDHGYLVPRADGRILVGSTAESVGFDARVTAQAIQAMLAHALEVCPTLAGATFLDCWAGLRPGTPDHMPLLGATEVEGLWVATGHFRNGFLLAPITAQLMADVLQGRKPGLDLGPFQPDRRPWGQRESGSRGKV